VVSAFVVITAQDTSFMRAATTDEAGEFEFASLPIGTYQLQVKADDFLTFEASRVRASIGQVVNSFPKSRTLRAPCTLRMPP
jgi:hypothetical protein